MTGNEAWEEALKVWEAAKQDIPRHDTEVQQRDQQNQDNDRAH